MIRSIFCFFTKLSISDWILLFTLLAIIWYSIETHLLRKWQKKITQLSIVDLEVRIKIAQQEALRNGHGQSPRVTSNYPETIRKIYQESKLDLEDLYSFPERQNWLKRIFSKLFGTSQ